MARKTKRVRVQVEGRDKGKTFELTEMSALRAEIWAADALFGLAQSGVDLPDDLKNAGMAAVVAAGFKALGRMEPALYRDLMARLMDCVEYLPDPSQPLIRRVPTGEEPFANDIEEVATRLLLKAEVFSLHTNFTLPGALSLASPGVSGMAPT